jgi:hypothetical protein
VVQYIKSDVEFILEQIKAAEAYAAASEAVGFQVLTLEENKDILLALPPNSLEPQLHIVRSGTPII